jgi:hypothetical protein
MSWLFDWPSVTHALLADLARFALTTPDIAAFPALQAVWQVVLGLSAGVMALLLCAAGGLVALPLGTAPRLGARSLLLRALAAVLSATQSLALLAWLIHLTDMADTAFAQSGLISKALSAPAPPTGILDVLLTILPYMALLVVLAVVYAVRLVELFALAAVAPLALACLVHPATDGLARAWATELAAVLLLQPAQALLLVLFQVALLDVGAHDSPVEGLVSSLALLYLTLRLPAWLRRFAHSAGQDGVQALLARAAMASGRSGP